MNRRNFVLLAGGAVAAFAPTSALSAVVVDPDPSTPVSPDIVHVFLHEWLRIEYHRPDERAHAVRELWRGVQHACRGLTDVERERAYALARHTWRESSCWHARWDLAGVSSRTVRAIDVRFGWRLVT